MSEILTWMFPILGHTLSWTDRIPVPTIKTAFSICIAISTLIEVVRGTGRQTSCLVLVRTVMTTLLSPSSSSKFPLAFYKTIFISSWIQVRTGTCLQNITFLTVTIPFFTTWIFELTETTFLIRTKDEQILTTSYTLNGTPPSKTATMPILSVFGILSPTWRRSAILEFTPFPPWTLLWTFITLFQLLSMETDTVSTT